MGRLEDKLRQAAGVAARLEKSIEADADALIAREEELMSRKAKAFTAHNTHLNAQHSSLDRLEDALQIIDNGAPPLEDTGHEEKSEATPLPEVNVTEAAAKPADDFQPTH